MLPVCACNWSSTQALSIFSSFYSLNFGDMLSNIKLLFLLSLALLFLLWKEAQGRCSSCPSNGCSQTGMSQGCAFIKDVRFWRYWMMSVFWDLHVVTSLHCAGNVTEPDTTLHPTRPPTMWQHIITKEPVRAPLPTNVAFGIGSGAQDTTLFTTEGYYLLAYISSITIQGTVYWAN